jgi:hypothetical protein
VKLTFAQLPKVYKKINVGKSQAIRTALLIAARRGATELTQRSIAMRIFNYGVYARAWRGISHARGAAVTNAEPYAGVIEFGRRPGSRFPPRAPIEAWVKRKLGGQIKQSVKARTGRKRVSKSDVDAAVKQAAFLIARKIARDGIQGKFVATDMLPRLKTIAKEEIDKAMQKIADEAAAHP